MNSASDKFTNYYKLLGVDAKADRQTVKQAYLAKIKEWHPDKNPDCRGEAEEKTKLLNQAYHILGDPEQRKNYDRMLRFTKGKDFNEYINDEAIRDKIDKAYPALKSALKNVRASARSRVNFIGGANCIFLSLPEARTFVSCLPLVGLTGKSMRFGLSPTIMPT